MSFQDWLADRSKATTRRLQPYFSRKGVSLLLIMIGVVLLGYVLGEYWGMYRSQHNLQAEWERQTQALTTPDTKMPAAAKMLTRVVIPKIGMDAIVVEGDSRKALSAGPGHMPDTPPPGEPGNSVITAHRDTFFRHIYELEKGDQIQVRRSGRNFTFEVTGKTIVMPENVGVIERTQDPRLTLITCYPIYYVGPAPKRLVVFSRLVESDGQPVKQAAQQHTGQ